MSKVWTFITGIELTALKRPSSRWQGVRRVAIVAAIIVAAFIPAFLLTEGGDGVRDIAGGQFLADLNELESLEQQISVLEDDPAAGAELAHLKARAEELAEQTMLGYLPREGDAPQVGALAPDFRLLDLQGNPVRLSELGRPAVINFWASWCAFCIEEMPDFQRVHELAGDDVAIIGINREESLSVAQRFSDETGARYMLLLDTEDDLGGVYRVIGMPTTLYVDSEGRVAEVRVGFTTFEQILESVESITGTRLDVATAPDDMSYGQLVSDLIASQRANHAVAGDLFARFALEPELIDDIVWQRNVVGQARAWLVNLEAFQALVPPDDAEALHLDLISSLLVLETAAALLEIAIAGGDAEQIERSTALFQDTVPAFNDTSITLLEVFAFE